MEIIKVIILGIIEGLTEFLPVSSTGHLIIVSHFMNLDGKFYNLFNIVIQSGAILAVIIYFFNKIKYPTKGNEIEKKNFFDLWIKIAIASVPGAFFGFFLGDIIEKYLFTPIIVSIALIVGAGLLFVSQSVTKSKITNQKEITYKAAIIVGFFQTLALIPGMSRSGCTIIGALLVGFNKVMAAEFSFYLAIPMLLGASFVKIIKDFTLISGYEVLLLSIGTVVSFVVAYLVIKVFMDFIKKKDFKIFGIYRIILGLIIIIFSLW